jgi:hypothetical protein
MQALPDLCSRCDGKNEWRDQAVADSGGAVVL